MKKLINNATDTFKEIIIYYICIIILAAGLFTLFEHRHFFDSIYWAFVTAMTVGYGDIYPITIGGRIVAICLMHIVPLILVPLSIARFLSNVIEDKNQFTDKEQKEIISDLKSIKEKLKL